MEKTFGTDDLRSLVAYVRSQDQDLRIVSVPPDMSLTIFQGEAQEVADMLIRTHCTNPGTQMYKVSLL